MSGMLNKRPWPDDTMATFFVVDQKANGTLVNKATGNELSCQPDGSWQERTPPAGGGPYEFYAQNGSLAVYNPTGGKPFAYLYWPNVPNV